MRRPPIAIAFEKVLSTTRFVWRASSGTWFYLTSASGYNNATGIQWGNQSLGDIPLRLVSQAASRRNVTFVLRDADAAEAMNRLHLERGGPDTQLESRIQALETAFRMQAEALDVFDLGIRPVVLTDCCASTLGAAAHLLGLAILSRNIGPHQLREAGLGEGTVAAPPTDQQKG